MSLQKLCLDLDGNLASAHSIEEFTFIQRMIRYEAASSTRAWIGGHDAVQVCKYFFDYAFCAIAQQSPQC